MAVITDNTTVSNNVNGFEKTIDKSAATMMLDNLQTFMYQKPIQSCVRECVSNAIDAVKEKRMAQEILTGQAVVSDYYVEKDITDIDGTIYRDSKFNRDYYDLGWLSPSNKVTLEYHNTEQAKRDVFTITDPGVGLGGTRLEGFFNLGYSSKRLNSKELGGFGLGAKSPLATGVESYRVVTRYNGKEFSFDIYSHKVDCVYGKWNEDSTENPVYEFSTGFKAHYKPTKEKNSTSIIVEVKKHNKNQYMEAVKSQLMYIKEEVQFHETFYNSSQRQEVRFKATIIYEDDNIILSDYNYYSRPHFVIKNIGYGIIDFNELELSTKFGNIGIKMQMEKIDVLPSREAVVYSPKTREAVLANYDKVTETVQTKVSEALNQGNVLDWIRNCNKVMFSSTNAQDIVSRLSSLIDKSLLKPTYKDTGLKYNSDITSFVTPIIDVQSVSLNNTYSQTKRKYVMKMQRGPADNMQAFSRPIYYQFGAGSARTSHYLSHTHKNTGFCVMRAKSIHSYMDPIFAKLVDGEIDVKECQEQLREAVKVNETSNTKAAAIATNAETAAKLLGVLLTDKEVKNYMKVVVPDSFKASDTEEEDQDEVDMEAAEEASRAEKYQEVLKRRKENKAFIANKLAVKQKSSYTFETGFKRVEIKESDLDLDTSTVVYGGTDEEALMLTLVDMERFKPGAQAEKAEKTYYWGDDLKIMKIADNNVKFVRKDGLHINKFLFNVDSNGVLTTHSGISNVYTANAIHNLLGSDCEFLTNFAEFDPELSAVYNKLRIFTSKTCKVTTLNNYPHPLLDTLGKAYRLNAEFAKDEVLNGNAKDEEARTELISKELKASWHDHDILDINIIDMKMYKEAVWIKQFAEVYGFLFNFISPLKDVTQPALNARLVTELKEILKAKINQLEGDYPSLNV